MSCIRHAHCHVCDELVKLYGFEFHGLKLIMEEVKTPPRTLVNELSASAVANDQQSIHKIPPPINDVRSRLLTTSTEEQRPIQNINSTFSNVVIPKEKNITLFSDSIPRGMKINQLISQMKEGRIHLKAFPGAKAESLRHSNVKRIQL